VPALAFDHFYDHDELTRFVHGWAEERPELVAVESIGASWEGREIWLVTLTSRETGPALDKPALLVEGNIHSVEWTGSTAALHVIQRLASGYGGDERVTRLLDTRCVYVIPRSNPDGAEHALREGRPIRSSVRPYPHETRRPGLHMEDADGDRRTLFMRFPDPNGPWKPHPDEPRLLVAREPDEDGGTYFRLLPEGRIEGWNGATVSVAAALEAIDLGSNLPSDPLLAPESAGKGPYPGSEPEAAALMRAMSERPNICAYVSCHTFGGVVLHPPASDEEEVPDADRAALRTLAAKAAELTGYQVIAFRELVVDPKQWRRYPMFDWFYHRLGIYPWITEFWNPEQEAGIPDGFHPSGWLSGDHPVEDELTLLRWSDEKLGGRGFVAWYPFDHPQLGPVELGGWDKINYWYNPPFELLEREVAPHTEWVIFQALASPLLGVRSLEAEALGEGVHRVRLVVQNTGWLPTYVTKKALEGYLVGPVTVELSLPDGATLVAGETTTEAGQLEGRVQQRSTATWWGYEPATNDLAALEWVVAAPAGGAVQVTARHVRAGVARAQTTLR
jgi:murein tripeptide amidase MpaA